MIKIKGGTVFDGNEPKDDYIYFPKENLISVVDRYDQYILLLQGQHAHCIPKTQETREILNSLGYKL